MSKVATMNPNLRDVWNKPSRIKTIYGGRASSKSWDAAANAIRISRHTKIRFLCTRMFQNKIKESVYSLLKIQIERFGLKDEFEVLRDVIKHKETGSEFLFYGLARNIDEIKSLESIDICWIEEAHALTQDMWDILEPTIRKENSEIWVIFNPKYITDFSYQRFIVNPPANSIVRKINYVDNPFLSHTALATIADREKEDFDLFKHTYLGEPLSDDDLTIIKLSWIEAAIGFELEPMGKKIIGFDVADEGDDDYAICCAHGSVIYDCNHWNKGDVIEATKRVYDEAAKSGSDVTYDSIGVGAGVKGKSNELASMSIKGFNPKFTGFNAGSGVLDPTKRISSEPGEKKTNKDHYANAKAQAWFSVAQRFANTYRARIYGDKFSNDELISISPDLPHLEALKYELCAPHKAFDNNMRYKVESKKDMKKRGVKSPNMADALIMCFIPNKPKGISLTRVA